MINKIYLLAVIILLASCANENNNNITINGTDPIAGCMDANAINYNENATVDDGSCEYENTTNLDVNALLANLTNNIIIPSYDNLILELNNLYSLTNVFVNNPTQSNLNDIRQSWVSTYVSWQSVEMFNINAAEEMEYYKTMNTYPCTPAYIENNITTQSYDLNSITLQSRASQGLPAVDYMLYGLDNDTNAIINYYTDLIDGDNYSNYLLDLISQMQSNTNAMINDWQSEKTNFINSSGNNATSSLNKITNDFIYYYEKGFRANKIGIPVGKWNGWVPYEIGVEAYYRRDISKRLAKKALIACKDFFTGKGINSGATNYSYVDLLKASGDDQNNLSSDIISNLELAENAINILNADFRSHLDSNGDNIPMMNAYDAIQNVVVLLKVDMLAALTIDADYADSDGD